MKATQQNETAPFDQPWKAEYRASTSASDMARKFGYERDKARSDITTIRADNDRLRKALEKIAGLPDGNAVMDARNWHALNAARDAARAALKVPA